MTAPAMSDDRESRLRRLEDAIEAFLERGASAAEEDLLAQHEPLADLIRPMLEHAEEAERDDRTVAAAAPGTDAAPLRRIGDLEIGREIGRGGMGVVYEAFDRVLKRRVAVKLLLRGSTMSASSIVRFRREAQLAAGLSHPSIVPVFSFGEAAEQLYLAMELVPSVSLADVLSELRRSRRHDPDDRQGPATAAELREMGPGELGAVVTAAIRARFPDTSVLDMPAADSYEHAVVRLLHQVAEALAHAHDRGIVHRDVKPANVLIAGAGSAFLTDFGLACVQDDPRVTRPGDSPGTPQYMAPEQVDEKLGALGPATDVFALGVTLYEALTLRRAFPGDTLPAVLYAVRHHDPIDPIAHNPNVAPDLVAILRRALQKDPAGRYPSAREFGEDLAAYLRGDPVRARPLAWRDRLVRRIRRSPWQVVAVLLLLIGTPVVITSWIARANIGSQAKVGEAVLLERWIDERLAEGFREAGEGDLAAASACFEAILERVPGSDVGIAGMSVLARRQGDQQALAVLEQHPSAVAGNTALRRRRAALLARIGDPAADSAARDLPSDLVDFDAFLAGYGLLELGHDGRTDDFAAARRMLHRACVTASRPRPLYYFEWLHAAAHDRHGEDVDSAIAAILRLWPDDATGLFWVAFARAALDQRDAAIEALQQALLRSPGFQQAAMNLAALWTRKGRPDEALRVLRAALPDSPRPADVRSEIGKVLVALHRLPEAIDELSAAIEAHPDHLGLRANFASALLLDNRWANAEEQIAFVLRAAPHDPEARYWLASVQLRRGEAKLARANLEQVVARQPTAPAYFLLGVASAALTDAPGAAAAYEKCLALDHEHAEALVNLANLRIRDGERETAEALLRRAIEAKPTLLPARRALLRVLDDRPAAAVAMCRDWLQQMPGTAEPLRHLAASMVRSKDESLLAEAMQHARAAAELGNGKDAPAMHVLATVQLWSGDAHAAKGTVEKALELLDPDDRFTPFYRQEMARTLAECDAAIAASTGTDHRQGR